MKRFVYALGLALLAATASAAPADVATLRNYASKIMPRCPDSTLTVSRIGEPGPAGFDVYQLKQTSSDQYCGSQRFLLYSPKTDQVLIGTVIPLAPDARPIAQRVSEKTSELLRKPHTASVSPFPLPDGLRAVTIMRATPYGAFNYHSFVDASGLFLVVGSRGNLQTDPAKTLRESLRVTENAVRRGNKDAKLEIVELSDFQCPSCARAHKQLEPLIQKNLSKINYYRLDLPLFEQHDWAVPAATAARAIARVAPSKYWEFVDHVFNNQETIAKLDFDKFVRGWTEDHDINWNAFAAIYNSKDERQKVMEQVSRAFSLNVASTPTFIINGQIVGYGPEGKMVNQILNDALKSAPAAAAKKTSSGSSKKKK